LDGRQGIGFSISGKVGLRRRPELDLNSSQSLDQEHRAAAKRAGRDGRRQARKGRPSTPPVFPSFHSHSIRSSDAGFRCIPHYVACAKTAKTMVPFRHVQRKQRPATRSDVDRCRQKSSSRSDRDGEAKNLAAYTPPARDGLTAPWEGDSCAETTDACWVGNNLA